MKIVIANGMHNADYIIKMFQSQRKKNQIIVINSEREACTYLSEENEIDVFYGDPYKRYVLEETNVRDADIFIALSENDTDNYVTCLLAKRAFNVKKCICIVTNPKNVDVYKELGIDSVISSTYLLGESVKAESSVEKIIRQLEIEDNIIMFELEVEPDARIANKTIASIQFPRLGNISCIYRNPQVIIPNGDTIIYPYDRLVIVTTPNQQKSIIEFVHEKRKVNE